MQTKLKKTGQPDLHKNVLIFAANIKNISEDIFTEKELKYIHQQFDDTNSKYISVNQYKRMAFILKVQTSEPIDLEGIRRTAADILKEVNKRNISELTLCGKNIEPDTLLAAVEGIVLANYHFNKYQTLTAKDKHHLINIGIHSDHLTDVKLETLIHTLESVEYCRDLVNEPLNLLNAENLAHSFEDMAGKVGLKAEVFSRKKIESLKMGGLLAVNKGSVDPPTFTVLEWKPDNAQNEQPYVLVGKGVVYDTGGMSLKPANYMLNMKSDMAGAATMASVMKAIAGLKLPLHIIALIPATDNRVNGNAYVPGDVITMYDGITVEVLNTDAEGRMILADALSYAKKYNPKLVINAATLTGSAARAIGKYGLVAMHSKAKKEIETLKETGDKIYERVAELPFWDEYKDQLKSSIADIKNIGGVEAGAITAGKFLEYFTDYPFIHLDIAGVAFFEKHESYFPAGGTGFGVRLLIEFFKTIIYNDK